MTTARKEDVSKMKEYQGRQSLGNKTRQRQLRYIASLAWSKLEPCGNEASFNLALDVRIPGQPQNCFLV